MSFLVLVVDDEPDVEMLFRQQFRRDLRYNRFRMDFEGGADALLTKPIDFVLLRNEIDGRLAKAA
jgi:hypothetical protein